MNKLYVIITLNMHLLYIDPKLSWFDINRYVTKIQTQIMNQIVEPFGFIKDIRVNADTILPNCDRLLLERLGGMEKDEVDRLRQVLEQFKQEYSPVVVEYAVFHDEPKPDETEGV